MFYEENGKIYPAIITSDYYEMKKDLPKLLVLIYIYFI